MKFETERLIMRPYRLSDKNDLAEGLNNYEIVKNLLVVPYPYTVNDAVSFIKKCQKDLEKKHPSNYQFALILKSENKVIGCVGAEIDYKNKIATTGSWINTNYQRQGYVTEAKFKLHDFLFKTLNLRKIDSEVFLENMASQNALEKLGFVKEGVRRQHTICRATGKTHDVVNFGLLKKDWKK